VIVVGLLDFEFLIIFSFGIIGAGLKFIDDIFDKDIFNKKIAIVLAPPLVMLWILLSVVDPISAMILFSVLFSVLLAGKLDNFVFKISALVLILFFMLACSSDSLSVPLLILTIAGIIDEKGNNYVRQHKTNNAVEFFFLHRFFMKMGVLTLCVTPFLRWLYLFAFLAFDIAYDLTGVVGQRLKVMDTYRHTLSKERLKPTLTFYA
jgi:hypothetical protein